MTYIADLSVQTPAQLPGYTWGELIYQGAKTAVYRAMETASQQPVVIKYLCQDYPRFGELVQFRNQYTITQNLPVPGIVRALGLAPFGNSYALIMEETGGISLEHYAGQQPLDLTEGLGIALQLAETLQALQQQRVIHKDIKPANILIHPESKQVKLIDFSIASLLPKETQALQSLKSLEGTLAYLAPEQTGRMNRAIDYRTDFYALGVTLYQLLTAQLPFVSEEPMELIHCHIAQAPIPVNEVNPDIPPMVSAIIAKLMAKNAEDRYQSALGLSHDLEQCLAQWKANGEITDFALGERDVCDRFLIPEKLYGREAAVTTLLNAFDRVAEGQSEMMLVAGFSGIGKTAVVNEVHKPIVKQRGYFIRGKFDQFNRNIPFSAFVQSFRSLMGQMLSESDAELADWRTQILAAVGHNGQVLIEVIPELESVIGKQPAVPELTGSAAQNRFNLILEKFIAVFTTQAHPLVIFLDDLQWADSASLNLIKVLMEGSHKDYLLLLGAYRDNEVFPAHPLMLTLSELEKQSAAITTLTLSPLSVHHINQLTAETLSCRAEQAQPLTELVYQKTQGNPFFTTQFLKGLYEDELIIFNPNLGSWECDLVNVREAALTDNVVEFMAGRLQKLPTATQSVLKLAACIGNQFDLETLAIVCETSSEAVAGQLWSALQEGILLPISEAYKFFQGEIDSNRTETITVKYRFLHDRIQQAAYSLIAKEHKQATHVTIGRLLLESTSSKTLEDKKLEDKKLEDKKLEDKKLEDKIFDIVNHLNMGVDLLDNERQRQQLASLNLMACRQARKTTAYQAGLTYAKLGIELMGARAWEEHYDNILELHNIGIELALLCGEADEIEKIFHTAVQKANSWVDCVDLYRTKILSRVARNKLAEAIAIAQEFFSYAEINLEGEMTPQTTHRALTDIAKMVRSKSQDDILALPEIDNLEQAAIIQIAVSIMPVAYILASPLLPVLIGIAIKSSLQYGHSPASPVAYAYYGYVACNRLKDVETGVKFGQIALALVSKLNATITKPEVNDLVALYLLHRKSHLQETLPLLQEGYTLSLEVGNIDFAGYNANLYCLNGFWAGLPLTQLKQEVQDYCNFLTQLNQVTVAGWCKVYWQSILNLLGDSDDPTILSGEVLQESDFLKQQEDVGDVHALYLLFLYKSMLCYTFENVEASRQYITKSRKHLKAAVGMILEPSFYFYDSLIKLSGNPQTTEESLKIIGENQLELKTYWANYSPMNHQHKVDLVEAEKHRVLGQRLEAIERYDKAIAGAKENKYIQEEALANELAAKFYLDWGKERVAAGYMQEAYYCYSRWDAKAKVTDLETRYPDLLRPILQASTPSEDMLTTLMTMADPEPSLHLGTLYSPIDTDLNQTFDFASILRASQALSGTIQLDELLCQLTQIILQNSGGDRCVLILPNETDEWQVRALATSGKTQLCDESLVNHPNLPVKLLQYVKNTKEIVVINDLNTELPVIDAYLTQHQPKSILGLPLLNQGKLIGLLYLNNRLISKAFNEDRILILNFLCTQAAIALENAGLYQQVQQSFVELQQAQLKLVQSEKMSALGGLVAGVAHEINNPVGCIIGNVSAARDYIEDLLNIVDLYAEQVPNPNSELEEALEQADLDYVKGDLPKLIQAMQDSGERIKSISKSLRTFSRADTEAKQVFDLHEGLESTVLILRHRLKANEQRPTIEVIAEYGEIPAVACFPGQLNQVFMNILANAIDALDEASQGYSFDELEENPNRIIIRTSLEQTPLANQQVKITISDNGPGIPAAVKARIFDHLFTTKAVGKGTGLGLAIAQQIVIDNHGGTLEFQSEVAQGTTFSIGLPIE